MDDASIEKMLSEKKFISKRDIEFIRKQATDDGSSFAFIIGKLKILFCVMGSFHLFFLLIGIVAFNIGDTVDFITYVIVTIFVFIAIHVIAPVILGAKLFFVSWKE
jgi:hypothetical protein